MSDSFSYFLSCFRFLFPKFYIIVLNFVTLKDTWQFCTICKNIEGLSIYGSCRPCKFWILVLAWILIPANWWPRESLFTSLISFRHLLNSNNLFNLPRDSHCGAWQSRYVVLPPKNLASVWQVLKCSLDFCGCSALLCYWLEFPLIMRGPPWASHLKKYCSICENLENATMT